jgi:hypothetical protein
MSDEGLLNCSAAEKKVKNLMRGGTIPDNVLQSSAFESLESMALKEYDATSCVICMGYLGSSDSNCANESVPWKRDV